MKYIKLTCLFGFTLVAFISAAQPDSYTEKSKILLKELEHEIAATLLTIARNEQSKDNKIDGFNCLLFLEKKDYINLGLLFELNNNGTGYDVTKVDSGSIADSLGIKIKDTLLSINNIELEGINKREVLNILNDLKIDETLTLALKSNGEYKTVSSVLTGLHIPEITLSLGEFAENACGIDPV